MADLGTITILDTETPSLFIQNLTYNLDISLPLTYGSITVNNDPIAQNEFITISQYGIAGTNAAPVTSLPKTGQLFPRTVA